MRAADLPLYYNAIDILEHNLQDRADKTALYSEQRTLTFQQVADEANRVGNALKKLDVRVGDNVAILTLDSAEWVTAFFGTLKIGAVAVGLNTLLKSYEFDFILNDCRARVLIVHENLLPAIEEIRAKQLYLEHIIVIGNGGKYPSFTEWIENESLHLTPAHTHREDFCMLNYSSGTTGEPKGIIHAHKDLPLTAQLWAVNVFGLKESDRTFAVSKLFFTFGTGGNLLFPWYVGASVILYAGPSRATANILETISRFKPTIFYNAPTGYAAILATADFKEKYNLSSLRICVSAGESLPAPIWQEWKERTGLDTIDGIGCTEVFHIFISNRPGEIRPGSSGRPITGFDVKIVGENGEEVPRGEVGNLMVRGETLALSYLHQYERSRRTFQGEWMFTGDKYYQDEDGYFWHAGRSDDMLKVGGVWVSPMEVESALISHPAVVECAVVGEADSAGLIKPKAYVILNERYKASADLANELIEHSKEKLAAYKRPRWIDFVDELPKTATGKIQRFPAAGLIMNVGIGLPNTLLGANRDLMVAWLHAADSGPFSSVGVFDRLPYHSLEPLTVLAAAAVLTERVRLATTVIVGPLRNTALLAKEAATIDVLSNGRLTLGIAVGARHDDYAVAGVEHATRGKRLDEQLAALRSYWEEDVVGPKPIQPNGPELIVGGLSDAAFGRAARYADGYMHGGGPPRAFASVADKARTAWIDAGRPGKPRLWAMGYFALDKDHAQAGADYLRHYYDFTGPFAERIAEGLLTTPHAVASFVKGYADAGCDELVLFPTVADLHELDRLAEVIA